ncbi:hypothetical protein [Streptomyces liliifuscus]|uniref:Uncharacterized protein n=1 Tax=Streptomyces liliifuscus TaxID=2797636 RepID=A0A7T7L7C4_9ACTN|nr:hypothetical protein [Streptomyces liliifuscus]QQM47674.1 hypothetical protein JEQ17_48445 [Streptomyces liliifuscus]
MSTTPSSCSAYGVVGCPASAGTIEGAGEVADQRTGGQPVALCPVSGTGGSQCTALPRKDA